MPSSSSAPEPPIGPEDEGGMPAVAGAAQIPASRCFDIRASPVRLRTEPKSNRRANRDGTPVALGHLRNHTVSGTECMALVPQPTSTQRHVLLRRLAIRCPVTGLPTDTGFELTALPQLTGEQTLIDCLECGQDHPWRVEEAYLD